jgi:hypothetical protein
VRTALASLAFVLAAPLAAQDAPEWRPVNAETGKINDVEGLEALAEDFPNSSSVRTRLLNARLTHGPAEEVVKGFQWLKDRGFVFDKEVQEFLAPRLGDSEYGPISALLIPQAEVIEASEVIATVPADAGLVESVFAPANVPFMVATSVTQNSIHIFVPDEGWTAIAVPGVSDLSGIVSEPDDSMGWAASANLDGSQDSEKPFIGLVGLRGDFQNPILVPAPATAKAVSDLTIGPDATVYASDPIGGGVYRKPIGATELEEVVAPGTFRSPQGLALNPDGTQLYVSDYRYGLAIIDTQNGLVTRLESDVPAILDGIDGLWRYENRLIAVQNGTSPMRISAFTLSGDGQRITAVETLEQSHPEWTEPLGGTISGDTLIYVGTGHWDLYSEGKLREGMDAAPTQIRRLYFGSGSG